MSESKNTVTLTDNEFESKVLKSPGVQVIDFWAEWCGPCRALGPVIDQLADQYKGKVSVYKLDIDANPDVPSQFQVRSIPTVLVFKDGQVVDRLVGFQDKANFEKSLNKHL